MLAGMFRTPAPIQRRSRARRAALACLAALALAPGCAPRPEGRLRTAFARELASRPSATESLRRWCDTRGIARPAQIRARRMAGSAAPPADLFARLRLPAGTALGHRNVELSCGGVVLSVAQLWYVPALLTPAMRTALDETDTPFGQAVAALNFTRERISQRTAPDPACPASTILVHRAVLRLPGGEGLALVIECYTRANLARPGAG